MEADKLAELLELNVTDFTKRVNDEDVTLVDLARLRAMEEAGENRKGVLKVIDDQFADVEKRVAEQDEELEQATAKIESLESGDSGKADRGEQKTAPWKDLGYVGPLTGDQAAWRNQNIVIKKGQRVYKKDVEDAESK